MLQCPGEGRSIATSENAWLFAFARPELYPESGGYRYDSWSSGKSSMWKRLFSRDQVTADEVNAMRTVVAKHGHLVRCLVVRSVQAFRIVSPYCTNLRAFHCRFEPFEWQFTWRWYLDMTIDEAKQVNREITGFVKQQQQHGQLEALHLMAGLMDPQCIHNLVVAIGTASNNSPKRFWSRPRHWSHFDAPLGESDYLHVNTLLPMVETARFVIRDLSVLMTPLATAHHRLRELDLQIQVFDHKTLQVVRASFPNLRRLFVRAEDSGAGLDLIVDRGATMLYVGASINPSEVVRIISLLPDLVVFDYHELNQRCIASLAQHCPRLRYVSTDRWVHRRDGNDPEAYPPSVSPLLTSCPDLERINTPTASIHMSDLVGEHGERAPRWIATQLKYLNCQLVGVPTLESVEKDVYQSLMARWPAMSDLQLQLLQHEGREEKDAATTLSRYELNVLRKIILRDQCRRALEEQLRLIPNAATWIEGFGALL
ncbi:hypothetical protein DFQ27_007451 [Actinomortierella ambigua]|uniref:Uncharacterized protein n=1 Tax=Actinomortierella ambigua TaxID=1343610 RepID=A0A9P6PW59_9FUNG|nr:hypothetical protein DFQ27_007451 [Actinomortierella ambigua]